MILFGLLLLAIMATAVAIVVGAEWFLVWLTAHDTTPPIQDATAWDEREPTDWRSREEDGPGRAA